MTLPGRYDLDPLATRAGIDLHRPGRYGPQHDTHHAHHPTGLAALADRLGITYDHLRHVARTGLTDRQADHWATRLGYMPHQIWNGQWWNQAPDEGDDWYSDDPPLQECTPRLHTIMGKP